MFIDLAELARRRQESNNLVERMNCNSPVEASTIPFDEKRFKKDGTTRSNELRTIEERALIGVAAITLGPEVAAETFDVSKSYATVLASGTLSNSKAADPEERERRNQELRDNIYAGLQSIRDAAREKLMMALERIDEDSLGAIKPSDKAKVLANIANQLSSVIDRTINKGENLIGERSTHLHLYAPETRPLSAFTIKRINPVPVEDSNATSSAE